MAARRASASAPLLSFEETGFGAPDATQLASLEQPASPNEEAGGYIPPPEVARAYQREAQRDVDRAAKSAEQEALERKHSMLDTFAAKFAEGALDAVTAPGALFAAGVEGVGAATGSEGVETFGRELGEAAQGKEALASLQFLFGGDGVGDLDAYDQEKKELDERQAAWPMLSSVSKLAGQAATGLASGGATAGAGLLKTAAVAGVEGLAAGAQTQYAEGAPLRDVLVGALTGGALSALTAGAAVGAQKGAQKSFQLAREAFEGVDAEKFANERALKAFGPRGADIRKLRTEENIQRIGRDARTYKLSDGTRLMSGAPNAEELAPRLQRALDEVSGELQSIRQKVIDAGDPVDARAFLKRVDEDVLEPLLNSTSPTQRKLGERVSAEIADLRGRVADVDDSIARTVPAEELASRVEKAEMGLLQAREADAREAFRNVETTRSRLLDARERLSGLRDKVDREAVQAEVKAAEEAFTRARAAIDAPGPAVKQAETVLAEARQAAASPVKPAPPVTYQDLLLQKKRLSEIGYQKDKAMGGVTLIQDHWEPVARMERILEGVLEDHVEKTIGRVEPGLAGRYKEVRGLTGSFIKLKQLNDKAIGMNLGNRAVSLTDYMTALTGANMAGGPSGFLGGLAVAGLHKMARERGSAFLANLYTEGLDNVVAEAVTPAVETVMAFAKPIARTGLAVTKQAVARRKDEKRRKDREPAQGNIAPLVRGATFATTQEYDKHVDTLVRLQQSLDDVTAGLEDVPGSSNAFSSVVATDYKQKVGKLLQDLPKPKPNPRGKAYESLSRSDLKLAADMWEATFEPMSIFDDFREGVVSYDKVKYVWEQFPGMQLAMQAGVQDFLSVHMNDDEKAGIPDSILTQIDFLLGYRGELQNSLAPGFSLTMSQAGKLPEPEEAPAPMPTQTPTYTQRVASRM